jgi:hypothetical protein
MSAAGCSRTSTGKLRGTNEHRETQTTSSKPYASNLKAPDAHSLSSSPIPNSNQGHQPSRKLHTWIPQGFSYLNLQFLTKTSTGAVANDPSASRH